MRNPSVHLRQSDLIKVLREIGYEQSDAVSIAQSILEKSHKYKITNRVLVYSSTKTKTEKLSRVIASSESDVELFNRTLDAVRKQNNHKFIRQILQNDKEFLILKEVAKIAVDFCDIFGYKAREQGFYDFCQIGVTMMGKKYALNKFKFYKSNIFELKESVIAIEEDDNKEGTEELYRIYQKMMLIYGNIQVDLKKPFSPEKFKHIVFARQEADENGADYRDWVKSQFEGLNFLDVIPELSQFYGEKAKERYERFYNKENKPETVDETTIVDYHSSSEQKYWEMIRKGGTK